MSAAADAWDLTVPDDPSELLAVLRSHGVKPGKRLFVLADDGEARSTEELQAAISKFSTAIASATNQTTLQIALILGPHLEALQEATKAVSMPELSKAVEINNPTMVAALDQLRESLDAAIAATRKSRESAAEPARPRRRFAFAGSFSAESDLASNADNYLARGFGRE